MVKFSNICTSAFCGLVAYVGLIGGAQAQNPDPYEQYYGPRPTPYSSTYSQPYQQPTYQQPQNPQPTYQAPQQYGQQPYYGGYQQPQYGGQPAQPADPYQQTRTQGQQQGNSAGSIDTSEPERDENELWNLYVGAGVAATYLTEYRDYTTEIGANVYAVVQARLSMQSIALLIGLELSYNYLGEYQIGSEKIAPHSVGLSIRPGIAIADRFTVYGRYGIHRWRSEHEYTSYYYNGGYRPVTYSHTHQDTDVMYGLGMEIELSDAIGMRVDYTEFEISSLLDMTSVTTAVYYKFY